MKLMEGGNVSMAAILVREEKTTYSSDIINQDALWKKVIWELFEEFIIFFEPNLHKEIDFSKEVDFLQQELFKGIIDKKKGTVYADQVVKVHLKNGDEQWILIHIEVEGSPDENFPKRMFRYFYRIYDKYEREIVAFVVLPGSETKNQYDVFDYKYFGTMLRYEYNVRKTSDYSEKELEQSKDLFSKVILAAKYLHKTKDVEEFRYRAKMKLMRDLLEMKEHSKEAIRAVFYFVDYLLRLPEDLTKILVEDIKPILEEGKGNMLQYNKEDLSPTMVELIKVGRREGLEQGEQRIKKQIIFRLLRKEMSLEMIAEITDMDIEKVKKIQQEYNG